MRRFILTLAATVALGAMYLTHSPTKAVADEYWDGHWGWYDNTYSPYYTRRFYSEPYYSGPSYRYGSPYSYGPSYGYYPGGPYYGSRYYGGDYYGTPNFGYRDYPGGAGQVRVGPLRFGWR